MFGGVAKIIGKVKADPTKLIELEAELIKLQAGLKGKIIVAESAMVASVNQSMQAEAKSEHWAQWLWRPVVGFTFCATIINNYILYPYFEAYGMIRVDIPDTVWAAMLAILGAAAYTRGKQKIEAVKLR